MNKNDNAAHHTYGNLFLLDLRILVSLYIKSNVRIFRRGSLCFDAWYLLNTPKMFLLGLVF